MFLFFTVYNMPLIIRHHFSEKESCQLNYDTTLKHQQWKDAFLFQRLKKLYIVEFTKYDK